MRDKMQDKLFAAKTVDDNVLKQLGGADVFEAEADLWICIGLHRNIVTALFTDTIDHRPFIFLEHVNGQSLAHWLEENTIDVLTALSFLAQIADGLRFIHQGGQFFDGVPVIHGDLIPENILVTDQQEGRSSIDESSTPNIKLTDLGLSRLGKSGSTEDAMSAFNLGVDDDWACFDELCLSLLEKATACSRPEDISTIVEPLVATLDPILKPIAYHVIRRIAGQADDAPLLATALNQQTGEEECHSSTHRGIHDSSKTDLFRLMNAKGVSLLKVGRYQAAVALYERALKTCGACVPFFVNAAMGLSRIGRFREALNAANEAIARDRDHYAGWNAKGVALKGLGRFSLSEDAFQIALDREPGQTSVLTNLAEVLRLTGRSGSALELIATKLTDQHSPYLTLLVGARCFCHDGNPEQAKLLYDVGKFSAPFYDQIWIETERRQCGVAPIIERAKKLCELSAFDPLLIGQRSTILMNSTGNLYLKLVY